MPISDRTQPPLRAVRTTAKCPICGKPVEPTAEAQTAEAQTAEARKYRPFCGRRCADIDLGRWLKEGYRVPTDEAPTEEDLRAPAPGEGAGPSNRK